ncbi:MAG: hypothetical protein Q8P39_01555 [Candidatus Yanofskybacteria bacterium]|nr:hypothetical protein [Candidatus Yanofskybacteria bacterium]
MKQQTRNKTRKGKGETLLEFAQHLSKISFKGPKDLSYNLDHYLYGTPKKKLPKELLKKTQNNTGE